MCQQPNTNYLEIIFFKKFSKEIEVIQKKNENYRTEKYNNKFKNSLCGVNSRVEMTEDRIKEREDK